MFLSVACILIWGAFDALFCADVICGICLELCCLVIQGLYALIFGLRGGCSWVLSFDDFRFVWMV